MPHPPQAPDEPTSCGSPRPALCLLVPYLCRPPTRLPHDTLVLCPPPQQAPDEPTYLEIDFEGGDPVAINGVRMSPATLLTELNRLGGENGEGLGRLRAVVAVVSVY